MAVLLRGQRSVKPLWGKMAWFHRIQEASRTKLGGRGMSLTENIDDAHSPTGSKQTSKPKCNFFGITGTF